MFKLETRYERTSDDPDEVDPFVKAKIETAKWTGEKLQQFFPGHPWFVEVKGDRWNAVVMIQIRGIMPADRWYVLKFRDLLTDAGGRMIMRAGGELLERYGIPRQGFSLTAWKDALTRYPITGRGHIEPLR
jgi:hypothetical protein